MVETPFYEGTFEFKTTRGKDHAPVEVATIVMKEPMVYDDDAAEEHGQSEQENNLSLI